MPIFNLAVTTKQVRTLCVPSKSSRLFGRWPRFNTDGGRAGRAGGRKPTVLIHRWKNCLRKYENTKRGRTSASQTFITSSTPLNTTERRRSTSKRRDN